MKSPRFAPLTGAIFVVLLIIGFIPLGGDTPDTDASAAKIISFYNDHQTKEILAIIVVALAALSLAFFAVAIRDYLRDNGGGEFWPTVALVGAALAVAGLFVAGGMHFALVDGANLSHGRTLSPAAMVAINALDNDNFIAFSVPLGIMLFGAAGAALKGGGLPKWMAWVGIVLGITFFTPVGFFGFGLTGIWIIIASIMMYRRSAPAARTA
jgi:predicted ABC-type sugar transport system permease subunit